MIKMFDMDTIYTQELVSLETNLTELAVKGTVAAVSTKIKAIKEEKIRNTYDEIISQLLTERDEAIRIAQSYKNELEKVIIRDDDIVHLHNTVSRLLEIFKTIQLSTALLKGNEEEERVKAQVVSFE